MLDVGRERGGEKNSLSELDRVSSRRERGGEQRQKCFWRGGKERDA